MASPFLGALGGSTVGTAVVRMVLDSKAYQAQMATAKGETQASLTSMGAASKKFQMYATAALAAAGVAFVIFAKKAIDAAEEHEQIMTKLTLAVGDNTEAFQRQADALQASTGYTHDEILAADAMLARFKLTNEQIQALIPRVLDYAAATGLSAADAALNLGKALLGNARALKTIGVDYTDLGSVQKNYNEIMAKTNDWAIKGTASADTYSKSQRQLAAQLRSVEERFGTALLPILKDFVDVLAKIPVPVTETVIVLGALAAAAITAGKAFVFLRDSEAGAGLIALLQKLVGVGTLGIGMLSLLGVAATDRVHDFSDLDDAIKGFSDELSHAGPQLDKFIAWQRALHPQLKLNAEAVMIAARDHISYAEALQRVAAMSAKETAQQQKEAAAHDAVTQALKAQKTAENELAGGLLGLISSARAVIADQKTLNDLRKKGKTDGQQYHDAELQILQDQVSETGSLKDYITTLKKSGDTQHQAIGILDQIAAKFGITKGQVRGLVGEVYNLNGALSRLPANTTTTVTTQYIGKKPLAAGGIIAGQSGFITGGPTYLVGEGSYPTFAGRGAEAVMPLNDRGIGIMAEAFSRAMARSRSGGITVNVAGKVERPEDIQQNLDWWMRSRGV